MSWGGRVRPMSCRGLANLVGPGRLFATPGDFYAAAVGLEPVPAELVGVVQVLGVSEL